MKIKHCLLFALGLLLMVSCLYATFFWSIARSQLDSVKQNGGKLDIVLLLTENRTLYRAAELTGNSIVLYDFEALGVNSNSQKEILELNLGIVNQIDAVSYGAKLRNEFSIALYTFGILTIIGAGLFTYAVKLLFIKNKHSQMITA